MNEPTNIYKVPQETTPEKGYHDLPGLSNSKLKLLKKSPKLFWEKEQHGFEEDTKDHHAIGTLIDLMLLDYEKFQDTYILQTWETPSSSNQKEFAERVSQGMEISEAYNASYKSNYKPDTLKRKATELFEELKQYIEYLSYHAERIPYKIEDQEMLMAIQNNAMKHPKIGPLLNSEKAKNHYVIQEELLGENFKCEVDLLVDLGKIVFNLDVKSTAKHLSSFEYEYKKYGYNKQQALYHKLIRKELDKQGRQDTVIQTACIAVSKQFPHEVLLFRPHPRLLVQGWQWVKETTDLYKFHKKTGFDYPRRTYEKGVEIIYPYGYEEPNEED